MITNTKIEFIRRSEKFQSCIFENIILNNILYHILNFGVFSKIEFFHVKVEISVFFFKKKEKFGNVHTLLQVIIEYSLICF